jgi:hypothetical protein
LESTDLNRQQREDLAELKALQKSAKDKAAADANAAEPEFMQQGDGLLRKPKSKRGEDEGEGEGEGEDEGVDEGEYGGTKTPGNKNPIPGPAAGRGNNKLPKVVTAPKKPKLSEDEAAFAAVSSMLKASVEEQARLRLLGEHKFRADRISHLSTSIFTIISGSVEARAAFEAQMGGFSADDFDPLDLEHVGKVVIDSILDAVPVPFQKNKAKTLLGELFDLLGQQA